MVGRGEVNVADGHSQQPGDKRARRDKVQRLPRREDFGDGGHDVTSEEMVWDELSISASSAFCNWYHHQVQGIISMHRGMKHGSPALATAHHRALHHASIDQGNAMKPVGIVLVLLGCAFFALGAGYAVRGPDVSYLAGSFLPGTLCLIVGLALGQRKEDDLARRESLWRRGTRRRVLLPSSIALDCLDCGERMEIRRGRWRAARFAVSVAIICSRFPSPRNVVDHERSPNLLNISQSPVKIDCSSRSIRARSVDGGGASPSLTLRALMASRDLASWNRRWRGGRSVNRRIASFLCITASGERTMKWAPTFIFGITTALLASAPAAAQEPGGKPAWAERMKQVHARFTGTRGTFACFGDSITVTMAFWSPLAYQQPDKLPPDMGKVLTLVKELHKEGGLLGQVEGAGLWQ